MDSCRIADNFRPLRCKRPHIDSQPLSASKLEEVRIPEVPCNFGDVRSGASGDSAGRGHHDRANPQLTNTARCPLVFTPPRHSRSGGQSLATYLLTYRAPRRRQEPTYLLFGTSGIELRRSKKHQTQPRKLTPSLAF